MSVRFILGRSGTGKTHTCRQNIIDALRTDNTNSPLVLLVPEQATYQAERAILADPNIPGYHRLRILSFNRLAFFLDDQQTTLPQLSRLGQSMIVHRLLTIMQPKLRVFSSSADRPGLAQQIARTITELHQYDKSPLDLRNLVADLTAEQPTNFTAAKFTDLADIYEQYLAFLQDRFANPDAQLTRARDAKANLSQFARAQIWVDGFAGFTLQETLMLMALIRAAEKTNIALCLDPSAINLDQPDIAQLDPTAMFHPTEKTYCDLYDRFQESRIPIEPPVVLSQHPRFQTAAPLAHLEKNIFTLNQFTPIAAQNHIKLISAANPRNEVSFVARQIQALLRRDPNVRYNNIAVIASDINIYQHYITSIFPDYDIPYFLDILRPAYRHPLIELTCAALDIALQGPTTTNIINYLKTDLTPIARTDVDLLENYCVAFGIDNHDWTDNSDWSFAPSDTNFDQSRINKIRQHTLATLKPLRQALANNESITAAQIIRLVFQLYDSLDIRTALSDYAESHPTDQLLPDYHQQCYDRLVDTFDEFNRIFATESLPAEELVSIIKSALTQLTLALIPPRLDQVLVGSIERSRHPDIQIAFIIGASQGAFPVPVSTESILANDDRAIAETHDFTLAQRTEELLNTRQYLTYIAFTRPAQKLYITYPLTQADTTEIQPSPFLKDLTQLYTDLSAQHYSPDQITLPHLYTTRELTDRLCLELGPDKTTSLADKQLHSAILSQLQTITSQTETAQAVTAALQYDNTNQLDPDLPAQLLPHNLSCSVTRLTSFAECPYKHFAKYILNLEPRRQFRFQAIDLGTFYHTVLEQLTQQLLAANSNFATADIDHLQKLTQQTADHLLQTDSFYLNFCRHSAHNRYIIQAAVENLQRCVTDLATISRAGLFRTVATEYRFGKNKNPLTIGLPNNHNITLNGSIDRLDLAPIDNQTAALVFDYKLHAKSVKWDHIHHGLDLQLPLYLLAAQNITPPNHNRPIDQVAGAFYIPIETKLRDKDIDQEDTTHSDRKANGIFNGQFTDALDNITQSGWSKYYNFQLTKDGPYGNYDISAALRPQEFTAFLNNARNKIIQLASNIFAANINVSPYRLHRDSPCPHCDFRPVCRFDWQINQYNILPKMKKSQIIDSQT
ncbi:MAG: exodeoxyribonuclease V subunit gamma [Sedimentisphaerales bacterium]|nr:exodeoxyribonuclease V subunit gamma [Sedimentisphaerales bacterium]